MEAWLVVAFILLTLTLLLVPIMHIINKARTNLVDIIEDEINSLEEQPTTYEEAVASRDYISAAQLMLIAHSLSRPVLV